MCGIAGAFRPSGPPVSSEQVLRAMADRLRHRGPDGEGVWRDDRERCGLAHRRLSIIDLSEAAAQPMTSPDGRTVVVFNGEIYNHAELRAELQALGQSAWRTDHSDTEVLLRAYLQWGLEGLHRLVGMFALAIYDARDPDRPLLHLVRDRIGIKPLYLARTATGEWLFASEIRALWAHPELHPEMDEVAFSHYLTFIVAPAPLTMFRGVFKIPAGSLVTVDRTGRAVARRWWDCAPRPSQRLTPSDLSPQEAIAELDRLLLQSVRRRLVSDVPVGVLLSGGVDSSLNVAVMSRLLDHPVRTFTIGYEEDLGDEFAHARRVARAFGTEHSETRITAAQARDFLPLLVRLQDEPIADNVCIPLYFLAQEVRRNGVPVVHVGEGADEQFLGYWWCRHYLEKALTVYDPARQGAPWARRLLAAARAWRGLSDEDREIRERARRGEELFWGGAACWWGRLRRELTPHPERFRREIDCPVEGLLPESHRDPESHGVVAHYLTELPGPLPSPEVLQKIPYLEQRLRLPEHLLMRVDKFTMAHAIEARVPYLDHEIVQFSMRLPASYKLRDGVGKWLLKQVATRYLEPDLVHRPKQGFGAPMESWFRDPEFARRARALVDRSELIRSGLLDAPTVRSLLDRQTTHGGGWSFQLWTLLNAMIWHESWIVGRDDCF
jgi:asparagine synthase (glutamine-hydrolysing)